MKFIVSRTSAICKKPCRNTRKVTARSFNDCKCKTVKEAMELEWIRMGEPKQMDGFVVLIVTIN